MKPKQDVSSNVKECLRRVHIPYNSKSRRTFPFLDWVLNEFSCLTMKSTFLLVNPLQHSILVFLGKDHKSLRSTTRFILSLGTQMLSLIEFTIN